MEMSQQNVAALVHYLNETLVPDPARRKTAENFLESQSKQAGFPILMLKILEIGDLDVPVRLGASVFFKNMVKKHWAEENFFNPEDKVQIKAIIVSLMLSVPKGIQKQLAAAVELISDVDFPEGWPNLLPELVAKLETQDYRIINGVLHTAASIFKRYRHQMKSPPVLKELQYVLAIFQAPLLRLFGTTSALVDSNQSNPKALVPYLQAINLMVGIFYALNCIDLPEFFEENITEWMSLFRKYLLSDYTAPELVGDEDDEKPGILHKIQAGICQSLNLYIGKYEEEFEPFYQTFVKDIWTLVLKLSQEPKFDPLATASIQFLTSVSTSVHWELFKEQDTLKMICERIVIPNMRLREIDLEMFEDQPVEFIRRDIEGSDTDTRRRAATELVKGLRKHFEKETTEISSAYISSMLQEYTSNPQSHWIAKDVAIYLVSALAVKSATAAMGTTEVSQLVPVLEFFSSQIIPELQNDNPPALILKADALKFISTFRQQLPKEAYNAIFPLLIKNLSRGYVVQTYAANCIDKLLIVRDRNVHRFGKSDIQPYLTALLDALFKVLETDQSKENEYVMKAIMRVVHTAQETMLPYSEKCVQQLVTILARICSNPTNPVFNHYLFETIAAMVHHVSIHNKQAVATFEKLLFEPFQIILQADVQEFAPYVFQILSLLMEVSPGVLGPQYMGLLRPLLSPTLWERSGNVPALVRLLQSYLKKGTKEIVANQLLEPILGIFQKLIASKTHDHEGFYVLESIVEHMSPSDFASYMKAILTIIFTRLQKDKTLKFIKSFIVFIALFIGKHGAVFVMNQVDSIQEGLFLNILGSLWLPNVQKVNGLIERKMSAIALTKLATECPIMLTPSYVSQWPVLIKAAVDVLERPEDESVPEDLAENIDVEDIAGYTPAYSKLSLATKADTDPFADVNPKQFIAVSLNKLSKENPGKLQSIFSSLPSQVQTDLMSYFTQFCAQPYIV